MAKAISWGKPSIFIGATGQTLGSNSNFELLATPVEDSTNLTGTQGDKTEATIEGGEAEATKYNAATFELTMNVRMALEDNDHHRRLPIAMYGLDGSDPDLEKYTKTSVAVCLIPADNTAPGFYCPSCSVSIMETYTAADGAMWEITLAPNVPTGGGKAVQFGRYVATKGTAVTVGDYSYDKYTIVKDTSNYEPV